MRAHSAGCSPALSWLHARSNPSALSLSFLLGKTGILITVTSPTLLLHLVQARAGSRRVSCCHLWGAGRPGSHGWCLINAEGLLVDLSLQISWCFSLLLLPFPQRGCVISLPPTPSLNLGEHGGLGPWGPPPLHGSPDGATEAQRRFPTCPATRLRASWVQAEEGPRGLRLEGGYLAHPERGGSKPESS